MKDRDSSRRAVAATLAAELRAVIGQLKRRLREQSKRPGDLTPSQVAVLLRLEREGPATSSSLARSEGMRPQSMGAVLAPLEAAGLVNGTADPSDGRQTLLSLSDQCREWMREGRAAREDWLFRTLQARLSLEELQALATSVELLKRLVDEGVAP
jgi:DNA-binding MarR family transcriptional regulator